jgi:peptide/nickel transport system substrate-binding protein
LETPAIAVRTSVAALMSMPDVVATYCDFNLIDPQSRRVRTVKLPEFSYDLMLAQVGIRASLNLVPNSQFIGRIQRRESQFYTLSWGVPTFDALYTLRAVMASRAMGGSASWNAGGYANAEFDALVRRVEAETDPEARRGLIRQAHALHNAELGHIPLYHMMIPWAVRAGVTVTHRADNQVQMREIRID